LSAVRFVAWLLAAVALPARAGPPFLTGDPDPADAGHWEISVGATTERRPDERAYRVPAFELNYGLGAGLEVSFESAWLRVSADGAPTRSGVDNSVIGLKWRILEEEKDGVSLALKPEWEFHNARSARKGLVEDENAILLDLRIQKGVGPVQLGMAVARVHPSKSENGWEYGVFVKHESEAGHTLGVELNGAGSKTFSPRELIVNLAAQLKMTESGKLLVGLGREVRNRDEPKVDLRAYLGWQLAF
jgi:hypothetical protein